MEGCIERIVQFLVQQEESPQESILGAFRFINLAHKLNKNVNYQKYKLIKRDSLEKWNNSRRSLSNVKPMVIMPKNRSCIFSKKCFCNQGKIVL